MTGLFDKHSYSGYTTKCLPGHCDCVPTTCVLCRYKWVVRMQQVM